MAPVSGFFLCSHSPGDGTTRAGRVGVYFSSASGSGMPTMEQRPAKFVDPVTHVSITISGVNRVVRYWLAPQKITEQCFGLRLAERKMSDNRGIFSHLALWVSAASIRPGEFHPPSSRSERVSNARNIFNPVSLFSRRRVEIVCHCMARFASQRLAGFARNWMSSTSFTKLKSELRIQRQKDLVKNPTNRNKSSPPGQRANSELKNENPSLQRLQSDNE